MARFYLDLAWDSPITIRAVRAGCSSLASVALGTLGPSNDRIEGSYPNTSAKRTTPSGSSVSLHVLTVKLS